MLRVLIAVRCVPADCGVFCLQWDLVCDRAYLKDLTQTILIVGVMFGALIFTSLSDKFGRKPVLLFSQWAMVIVGVANAFAPNYYVFTVFRFFTGMIQQVCLPANAICKRIVFAIVENSLQTSLFIATISSLSLSLINSHQVNNYSYLNYQIIIRYIKYVAIIMAHIQWRIQELTEVGGEGLEGLAPGTGVWGSASSEGAGGRPPRS